MEVILSPTEKLAQQIRQIFVGEEIIQAEQALASFGFCRTVSHFRELIKIGVIVGLWVLITWLLGKRIHELDFISWANAISLGVAIVVYQQWRLARYEISIDKYYDRIDTANKRLEVLYDKEDREHRFNMLVFAELDKLEYVIFKYDLGFISPILAKRAATNFKKWCMEEEEWSIGNEKGNRKFDRWAAHWVHKAGYYYKTQVVVEEIRKNVAEEISKGALKGSSTN